MTLSPRYSVQDYLRIADDALDKLEFAYGEILAMFGGTASHSLIAEKFGGELRSRLKSKPCRVYDSNLRVGVPGRLRYMYPDKLVICGKPQFDPRDKKELSVFNPRLVLEVLSPSSEKDDRGDKFTHYRRLDAFQEYVLASQERSQIETFYRQPDGTWLFDTRTCLEAVVRLRSLDIDLPLAEIYAGVEFPPAIPEDDQSGTSAE